MSTVKDLERIAIGSGYMYLVRYTPGEAIPEAADLEKEENLLGYVKNGATLEYAPEFYSAEDDMGHIKRQQLVKESVTFTTGIMTVNGSVLEKLASTARVTEKDGVRTVKIGGLKNYSASTYLIRFVHPDETNGDVRITLAGQNTNGFSLAYVPNKETVIDVKYAASPNDQEGTLVIYEEELPASAGETPAS